jgi:hypothetical protein
VLDERQKTYSIIKAAWLGLLNLLQKWLMGQLEFEIIDGRNQVETKSKALEPVPIKFAQNTKDFQLTNGIFDKMRSLEIAARH